MTALATRVQVVAAVAADLDPWTRLQIRDRLAELSRGHDPALRHLLTAAAAWLAAVSDSGEQVALDGEPLYLMPAEPQAFTGLLAHVDDLEVLRTAVGMALSARHAAVGTARLWWDAFARALAAAAAAIEDAAQFGTDSDDWRLE